MKLLVVVLTCFLPGFIGLLDLSIWFLGLPYKLIEWNELRGVFTFIWCLIGFFVLMYYEMVYG